MNDELKPQATCCGNAYYGEKISFCYQCGRDLRPPVEAQAKGEATGPELNLSNWLSGSGCSVGPEPAPQPTPPAAGTRENKFMLAVIDLLASMRCAPGYEGKPPKRMDAVKAVYDSMPLPHPEPQAPRVSEDAWECKRLAVLLRVVAEQREFLTFPVTMDLCKAANYLDAAALSQAAQGEGKTEAEDALILAALDFDKHYSLWFENALRDKCKAAAAERAKGRGEG